MITKIEIKGFRILREFTWEPKEGVNIIVGANSVGKSTILDAIELATKGTLHGIRARGSISPDWFNTGIVEDYFSKIKNGNYAEPPAISIAITLGGPASLANLQGCQGPNGVKEDEPGLWFQIRVPGNLVSEFTTEAKSVAEAESSMFALPTEYYECVWNTYKGEALVRRPKYISCSKIDTTPEPFSRAVDSLAKHLIDSQLDDDQLRSVAGQIRSAKAAIDAEVLSSIKLSDNEMLKAFGIQTDKSPRSDWKNSVVLAREGLPLAALGSADQVMAKAAASMAGASESPILLMEEPECHLSHTALVKLLSIIESAIEDGQQAFVTTHSPFVLNRLGLDRVFIMADERAPKTIGDLSSETIRYFKRLSGYDTLRIILAERTVLVEGPTDEMVFDWAFHKLRGTYPEDRGIDVIEYGTRYKRAFELAEAVGKSPLAALRDNDDKSEAHWEEAADLLRKPGERELFVGHDNEGRTIEPQMVQANRANLELLADITCSSSSQEEELEKYLIDNKALWSLYLLEYDTVESEKLEVPTYIKDAIDFIDPLESEII